MSEAENKRVPIFVFPETREKLALIKDRMRRQHGRTVFLDEALNELIDGHALADVQPPAPRRVRRQIVVNP